MDIFGLIALARAQSGSVSKIFHFKGVKSTTNLLPIQGEEGDVYKVEEEDSYFAWNGESWTDIGQILTMDDVAALFDQVEDAGDEQVARIVAKGEETLDSIPADYTALTEDVSDLKSALQQQTIFADTVFENGSVDYVPVYTNNNMNSITGEQGAASPKRTSTPGMYFIPVGCKVMVTAYNSTTYNANVYCYRGNKSFISVVTGANIALNQNVPVPSGTEYMRFFVIKRDDSNLSPSDAASAITFACVYDGRVEETDTRVDELQDATDRISGYFVNNNLLRGYTPNNGYYDSTSHSSNDYKYFSAIPVENGKTYIFSPRVRMVYIYSANGILINYLNQQNITSITAEGDGFAYVTFYNADVSSPWLFYENGAENVYDRDYVSLRNDVIVSTGITDTLKPILLGKKIAQFGDSIMAGDGASALGPGERLAQKYGITCLEYAIGGATMGYLDAQHSHIIDQINLAITNGIEPDIILFNGGTNDMYGSTTPNCALGTISDVYTEPDASDEFSNGFESVAYKIKTAWPDAMVVYVRAHNMSSRKYDRQISYGEQGIAIADKWGFGVIDMYKRMNTQLSYYQQTYLSDATHPNADGYAHYYIPAIEQYLYEHRNELD